MPEALEPPLYEYTLEALPPGRLGRRWRWTLFHGDRMLAAGWRLSQSHALRGLGTAATRAAHEALGLRPLRPERLWPEASLWPGTTVRLRAGAVECVLVPRGLG